MKKLQLVCAVAALVSSATSSVASAVVSLAYEVQAVLQRRRAGVEEAEPAATATAIARATTNAFGGMPTTVAPTLAAALALTTGSPTTASSPARLVTVPASLWSEVKKTVSASVSIARHYVFHAGNSSPAPRFRFDTECTAPGGTLFAST